MIKREIKLILLVTLFGIIITALVITFLIKPVYSSKATLLVDPDKFQGSTVSGYDVSGGLRASGTIKSWIVEDSILSLAVENMENDNVIVKDSYSIDDIKKMMDVEGSNADLFIYVTFKSSDKNFARIALDYVIDAGMTKANSSENGEFLYPVMANSYNIVSAPATGVSSGKGKLFYLFIGGDLSVFLGLALAVGVELIKNKIYSVEDAKTSFGLPILGYQFENVIDDVNSFYKDNESNFERLATNITYSIVNKEKNIIAFSSSSMGEGKSSTIKGLANTLMLNQKRALIIDLDLHRPSIHKLYNLERKNGVIEYITTDCKLSVKKINDCIDVITSGAPTPNPNIILSSDKLNELIRAKAKEYDYILLDTPPVLVYSDIMSISKLCDSIVYIVAASMTRKSLIKGRLEELTSNNIKILGLNVTHIKASKRTRAGLNYYYDYIKDTKNA